MSVPPDLDRPLPRSRRPQRHARRGLRPRRQPGRPAPRRRERPRHCSASRSTPTPRSSSSGSPRVAGRTRAPRAPRQVDQVRRELDEYFEGRRHAFDLSIDLRGVTPFAERVLMELARVPFGETATYAEPRRAGRQPEGRPRGRHDHEPQPDPDRPPLPPRDRRRRQPRRLRRRARAQGGAPHARGRAPLTLSPEEERPRGPAAANASEAMQRTTAWNASTPASRTAPAAERSNGVSPVPPLPAKTTPARRRSRRREDPPTRATVWFSPSRDAREVLRSRCERRRRDRRDDRRQPDREEADAREAPRPGVGPGGRGQEQQHRRPDRGWRRTRSGGAARSVGVAAEPGREQDQADARRREDEPGERRREAEELEVDRQEEQVRAERGVVNERDEVRAREPGNAKSDGGTRDRGRGASRRRARRAREDADDEKRKHRLEPALAHLDDREADARERHRHERRADEVERRRGPGRARLRHVRPAASTTVTAASGTLIAKTHRHETVSTMTPPSGGPPIVARLVSDVQRPIARPASPPSDAQQGEARGRQDRPADALQRAAGDEHPLDGASAVSSEASANRTHRRRTSVRRPTRSPIAPPTR